MATVSATLTALSTGSPICRARHRRDLGFANLPSPMADFGYDISDYTGIDPLFGTLDDFDALIARRMTAVSRSFSISCRTTPRTSIPGSWRAELRRTQTRLVHLARSRAGRRAAEQLAVGFGGSAWSSIRRPDNTTTTLSSPSSPISTGATPRCARPSPGSCGSGLRGRGRFPRRRDLAPDQGRQFATTRPIRIIARAGRRMKRS